MRYINYGILISFLLILSESFYGQHTFKAILKDSDSKSVLIHATAQLNGTSVGGTTNENGFFEII